MYLTILCCICIFCYSLFANNDDGLIYSIRKAYKYNLKAKEYNLVIQEKIKNGECRCWDDKYTEEDLIKKSKYFYHIFWFLFCNILLDIAAFFFVLLLSVIISCFYNPTINYDYSFNINSLKDNLTTSGEVHGSMFCVSGYIDGEINYYYSRTLDMGEKIEHIPASSTYVKYDDTKQPNITVYRTKSDYPEWYKKILFICSNDTLRHYVITVPNGTIVNNGTYQIDME